jgi:colanic acid/amylovoran biosynthesis glycosyltransferase
VIEKFQLEKIVNMMGYCSHAKMIEIAYKHHVFLSPSVHAADGDSEGGAPVSIIEMAASGMPIVSTFHCDIPEVIDHGISGLLAPERDVETLIQHLTWLVKNPEKWSKLIYAARAHIEAEYDMETQALKLEKIYRKLQLAYD